MSQSDSSFAGFKNKNVLFITTKNLDYIRNSQEIRLISESCASCHVLGYGCKSYAKRLFLIWLYLIFKPLGHFDAVFVGFAPQLILPFFARRFKGKFVAEDFFISVYDTFVCDRKKVKKDSFAARFMHRIDEKTLRLADEIIADTRAHAQFFVHEFGADSKKMRVLYLEADSSIYYPHEVSKDAFFEGGLTILYFGSILPLQGTETILRCIELLKKHNDIKFDIIGPVGESEKEECADCNVKFTPWLSQNELSNRIAAADLCLAGHFNAEIGKARRTIPGKAYIYEAMGKPMILGDNAANHELFENDEKKHFFVEMGSPEKLAEKVLFAAKKLRQHRTISG